jgi:hypothetical protein
LYAALSSWTSSPIDQRSEMMCWVLIRKTLQWEDRSSSVKRQSGRRVRSISRRVASLATRLGLPVGLARRAQVDPLETDVRAGEDLLHRRPAVNHERRAQGLVTLRHRVQRRLERSDVQRAFQVVSEPDVVDRAPRLDLDQLPEPVLVGRQRLAARPRRPLLQEPGQEGSLLVLRQGRGHGLHRRDSST